MKRKEHIQRLTRAEEDIMQIIWQLDRCLVKDIIETMGQEDIPHSTIASVVRILEKKGFVGHKAYGKTHEYFPLISKEDYAQSDLSSMMDKYFGGSPKNLVSFLVEKDTMGLQELNELYKALNNAAKKK